MGENLYSDFVGKPDHYLKGSLVQELVEVIEFTSPSRLLAYLRPSKRHWQDGHWIFRGQRSAADDWRLLPSAWRQDATENGLLAKIYNCPDIPSSTIPVRTLDAVCEGRVNPGEYSKRRIHLQTLVLAEYSAVSSFIVMLDRIGVPVPDGGKVGVPDFERLYR
jgi:hypothetical protein